MDSLIDLKKDSPVVFVIGMVLIVRIVVAVLYSLSLPLVDIVIVSAFAALLWLNGLRMSKDSSGSVGDAPPMSHPLSGAK